MLKSEITRMLFYEHSVRELKRIERDTAAGNSCMCGRRHSGWTDDVISGAETVIDIAYIFTDVYSTILHDFPKGTP